MTIPIHLLPEHAPRVDARDHTCTVVPFPCDQLIKQAAQLTPAEFEHFAKEVGALRRLNNNDIDDTALNALVGE